jgi:ribosomal protein S4E
MTTVIHINQHKIKANTKHGTRDPVVTFKGKHVGRATYCHQAVIVDEQGNEVARVIYRPDKPLSCGARCWVETKLRVIPILEEQ